MRCLLAAGAEPRYALYNVVAWSGPEAVETARALLDAGADASGRGVPGMSMSPLHWAARSGDADMVRLLIARGADPNARDTSDLTVLHHSMSILGFNDERTAQIVAVLVAAGADRDAADRSGQTPRMRASESGHPALIAAMNGAPGA